MFGLISYLSTIAVLNPLVNIILLPVAFYRLFMTGYGRNIGFWRVENKIGMVLLCMATVFSIAAFIFVEPFSVSSEKTLVGSYPYLIFIFLSLFVGLVFKKQDLCVILVLVMIEIFVGAVEYGMGIHTFFPIAFAGQTQIGDTDLLYFNRVFGLSLNSSVYAFKVLVGLVILFAIKPEISKWCYSLSLIILAVGFITSFNRTAIIAGLIGLFIQYRKNWKILTACGLLFSFNIKNIIENFSRGKAGLDLSGRDLITQAFIREFEQRPLVGNAAQKLWLDINGDLLHAHNSYLEFLVSNGILITIIFFTGYYLMVLRGQLSLAAPLLVYSILQYGLLWGLAFNDIVFFGLMFYRLRINAPVRNRQTISENKPVCAS